MAPFDIAALTAIVDKACVGMKEAAETNSISIAPADKNSVKTKNSRPHKWDIFKMTPPAPYFGVNNYKLSSERSFIIIDTESDDMLTYQVIRLSRTDSEPTFVYKRSGDLNGTVLPNLPLPEYQVQHPKTPDTKDCAFYHVLKEEYGQCIEWRKKLGSWLAQCLGMKHAADADRYILGALPEGYTLWEHVRGYWALPDDTTTKVDPRQLVKVNGKVVVDPAIDPFALANNAAENNGPLGASPATRYTNNKNLVLVKRRDDLYLYGLKDNKRYAAPAEFFPHLLWLATARVTGPNGETEFACTCHHCDPELEKERKAQQTDRIYLAFTKWKENRGEMSVA